MAELGIVASALQIADLGIRLSLRLYTFGETVAGADKSIISISKDVSLTSTVLKELGQTLERDQTARVCSPNAVQTAESIAKECQRIFQDMDQVLVKKFANTKSTEKDRRIKAAQTLERLRWPFIKGKIELLTSNLERQKSTLVLMLNVITLAKQEYERTEPYTIIAEQRSLIQDLARSNEEYTRKFEQLKLSCEGVPVHPEPILADYYNSMPTPKINTAQGAVDASAVGVTSLREPSTGAQGLGSGPYMGSWYFHGSDTSLPDHLSWLQQQYRNLMNTLLIEVSAPSYEIADDSRSRIKAEIVTIHIREMQHVEQIQYSRPASLAKPMAGPIQQMHAQQHGFNSLTPIQQMQAQQQSFLSAMPIQQKHAQQHRQHSFNSRESIQQMQAQQSLNSQMPIQRMQAHTNSSKMPVPRNYYDSHGMQNCISQNPTYNSHSAMFMGATSHSTRGEQEQTSAAQSRPSMPSMIGSFQPPGGQDCPRFQQSAMGAMSATSGYGTNSSGVDPRATILHSGQRQSLSKPQPGITTASAYETSQSPSLLQHCDLPNSAKGVDQESSMYGKSAGESDQRRPESQIPEVKASPSKTSYYRSAGTRKRKLDTTGLSSQLPVEDSSLHMENKSSSPRLYRCARRHKDHTAVTENTKISKGGASDEMHLATSCEDSGNKKASKDNDIYGQDEINCNVHRERSLERTFENHTPEDWAENVVDKLLAAWTTLPVSANRTASQHGGFAVVAH